MGLGVCHALCRPTHRLDRRRAHRRRPRRAADHLGARGLRATSQSRIGPRRCRRRRTAVPPVRTVPWPRQDCDLAARCHGRGCGLADRAGRIMDLEALEQFAVSFYPRKKAQARAPQAGERPNRAVERWLFDKVKKDLRSPHGAKRNAGTAYPRITSGVGWATARFAAFTTYQGIGAPLPTMRPHSTMVGKFAVAR